MSLGPELILAVLFGTLLAGLALGFPVPFVMLGSSMLAGLLAVGPVFFHMMVLRVFEAMSSYTLIAIVLFVFMGLMLEKSGAAERLFTALHILLGRLRGGLALSVIAVCTVMAAATGIMGASVIIMGLVALPRMLERGYDPALSSGTICAGGTLGILIPPSIMLIVYAPMAGISVGKLFLAAVGPGLLLTLLYALYILFLSRLRPEQSPVASPKERTLSLPQKLWLMVSSLLPALLLILAVLGSIFFGVASPTEAAAVGAFFSVLLTWAYGNLSLGVLRETFYQTTRISGMILLIVAAAFVFTGAFMMAGGGTLVKETLLALPMGTSGILLVMTLAFFLFGLFMEWVGIVPVLVPIFTPVIDQIGVDPLWAAMLFCLAMQTSFLTPPMAPALFYLKGVAPPGIRFGEHIAKGVVPFIAIQLLAVALIALFPDLVLWLPGAALG